MRKTGNEPFTRSDDKHRDWARARVQSQERVLTRSRYSVQTERQYPNTIRSAFTHQTYEVDAIFSSCNRSTFITAKAVKGMWAELRDVLPRPLSKIISESVTAARCGQRKLAASNNIRRVRNSKYWKLSPSTLLRHRRLRLGAQVA